MILRSIVARRFRGIKKETQIAFSSGLNVIKGEDNEAGKSSLRIAITKALFQDPTTTQKDIVELTSWGTDQLWEVELEFQIDSATYRIVKSLKHGTCELIRLGSNEATITSKGAISTRVTEFTGCPSEIFFESTACIGQDELIGLIPPGATATEKQKAFGTITQRLQATVSGAEEVDVSTIVSRLQSKTHRKEAKGPYAHLLRLNERIESLEREKAIHEDKVNRVIANRKELDKVKEELEQIDQDLPAKKEILDKNNKMIELQKGIDGDKAQYTAFKKANDFKVKADRLNDQLKEFVFFDRTEEKAKQMEDVRRQLEELERQTAVLHGAEAVLQRQRPSRWILISGSVVAIAGLGGLIASVYSAIAAVAGLFLVVYWLISYMAWKRQGKSTREKKAQLDEDFKGKVNLLRELLRSWGFDDYKEYETKLGDYREKLGEVKEVNAALRAIVGDQDWAQYETENLDLDIRVSAKQKELDQLASFKLTPLDLQKIDNDVKGLQTKRDQLQAAKTGLEKFFELTDADTDHLASVEEELDHLKQQRQFWARKQKVYEITRTAIDDAHKHTLSRAAIMLESELSKYIAMITDGRYSQVEIDESDLSIHTFSPEKNDWVGVHHLSRATQDQFYICARFALVNLITEGKKPPLLLDDPFVNFHQKRLARTIPLLQELAKENQILLFTCSDAYDNYGNVIMLD
ncbi:MAG: hypothetical protein FJ008_03390 [Chloroflexi bacterium]|nr:hypothetical protein [Chloroflexota bacterium]MBM3174702.1 hypothetical protein [Chloroflexota bacterium]MBM4449811.1 hypothetical protein [Chloroflexota bacterium]